MTAATTTRASRIVTAWTVTATAALLAAALWVVAQARYTEDYCHTRAPQPRGDAEGLSGRPGHLDGPLTIRCEYDRVPDIAVTDPLPLIGAMILVVLVGLVAVAARGWARQD